MSQDPRELLSKNIGISRKPFYCGLFGAIVGLLLSLFCFKEFIVEGALQATIAIVGGIIIGVFIGLCIAEWKCIIANMKCVIAKWKCINKKTRWGCVGGVIGVLLGIPASYFMQSGMLRTFVSIVEYSQNIIGVLKDGETRAPAIIGIIVCGIAGSIVGAIIARQKITSSGE